MCVMLKLGYTVLPEVGDEGGIGNPPVARRMFSWIYQFDISVTSNCTRLCKYEGSPNNGHHGIVTGTDTGHFAGSDSHL